MKPLVLLLLVCSSASLASAGQLGIFGNSLTGGDVTTCSDKCTDDVKEGPKEVKSCQTGCRLLNIIEMVDMDPTTGDFEETIKNCNKSCEASFKDENERASCELGCSYQVPISKERRSKMTSSLDSFFGNTFKLPRMTFGFPSSFGNSDSVFGRGSLNDMFSSSNLGGIFQRMQDQMHDMMNQAMSQTNGDGEFKEMKGGSGRLVVIKSGPGYHEEKTYNFGPDGVKTETKSSGVAGHDLHQVFGKDMMEKVNPMEHMNDDSDVEIFEPREVANGDKKTPKAPVFSVDILAPFVRDSSNQVSGFDFGNEIEGPRLPQEGRNSDNMRLREEMCARNNDNMKWSDWVSCLHMRMGLPRWLTAATLSLGIVFIIWLCLVIPHSAPRQRVKATKAMEAAGKLEKEHLANLSARPDLFKLDLPPSYDDIANLHVAVPVATGLLPEKKEAVVDIPKI